MLTMTELYSCKYVIIVSLKTITISINLESVSTICVAKLIHLRGFLKPSPSFSSIPKMTIDGQPLGSCSAARVLIWVIGHLPYIR